MIRLLTKWVDFLCICFLILGFFVSLLAPSVFAAYFIIFISGMIAGRMWYQGRKNIKLPTTLVVAGFVLGYSIARYKTWEAVLIMFIIGTGVAYYIYDKGYLKV